ncbi:MAG: hypothetical protein J7639_34020, partial [Paenibacillaceae bacterium]|nr:hypothetical protein [Paenibacillaceae bacterium]
MQPLTWDETNREALMKEIGERFDTQGYVIIRRFFDQALIEQVKLVCSEKVDALADKLKANGVVEDAMEREPFDKRLYQLFKDRMDLAPKSFDHTLHVAELYELFFNRKLLDVMACFLGEELRLYPNYTVRPKFPLWEGTHVLWHQDGGYTKRKSQHLRGGSVVHLDQPVG